MFKIYYNYAIISNKVLFPVRICTESIIKPGLHIPYENLIEEQRYLS
jgi:hypothetical protein